MCMHNASVARDLSHMTNTARKHKQTRNWRFHLNAIADKSRFTTARPKLVYRHFSRSGGASERAHEKGKESCSVSRERERDEMTNRAGYRWSHLNRGAGAPRNRPMPGAPLDSWHSEERKSLNEQQWKSWEEMNGLEIFAVKQTTFRFSAICACRIFRPVFDMVIGSALIILINFRNSWIYNLGNVWSLSLF